MFNAPRRNWFLTPLLLLGVSCSTCFSQITDTRIPLNYNFHGMAHAAAITGGADEWTTVADNANADRPNSFRSVADRALVFDPSNNRSPAFYSGQSLGLTGLTYEFFNTLGYGNTTAPDAALNGLDLVHLGARCAGFPPATIWPYEAGVNTATNVGIAPAWDLFCDHSGPQTTNFAPIALDPATEIGILFHNTSLAGQFDVVLGFSDHAPITVRFASLDWFGIPADPAILANQPVSSQGKIGYVVGGTTFRSFQGCDNNDAPVIRAVTTGAGPNLNIVEGIISIQRIISGVGTTPPDPTVATAHLNSLTFQNASYPASGGRGYAIFAATVRAGQPTHADCSTPMTVFSGTTALDNRHTFGAAPTSCGVDDTSAVYFRYTAANTGLVQARTCGSLIDTTLAVYSACGSELACNDNACGPASAVNWNAMANQAYIIRVAGRGGATGAFTLTIDDPAHVDTAIPLNYNFHGMAHAASITGGSNEWTTVATNANADTPNGYRSIADRGLIFDPANNRSIAFYSGQLIGVGGLSYQFFDTLGYGNTTATDPELNGLDLVHLGSRCAGFPPASNNPYEAVINATTNIGVAPAWDTCDHTGPQTTNFAEAELTATSAIGILYHGSNSGGQFDVVLGFSDHAPVTVRVAAPDWFGVPANPAIVANNPVSSQTKLSHIVSGVSTQSFQGATNNDAPVIAAFVATGAGPNLNVMEAVISIPLIVSGIGSFPADPTIVGAHLNSITFQNATYPATGGRGWAILAATVRDASFTPTCVADVDDGSGTGTRDGGVTIEDLLYYLAIFDLGDVSADIDDGSGTGTRDGGVTIEDLLYFLLRFDLGC